LKHKHVERRHDKKTDQHWLVLNHPATKTTADPVHTMPNCVHYYDELIAFRKKQFKDGKASSEYLDPNDYAVHAGLRKPHHRHGQARQDLCRDIQMQLAA
jgi:hypothetical protein